MKTAIAFTSTIKNSKIINENFGSVINSFKAKYNQEGGVKCEIDHVDGTMPMALRKKKLEILEEANETFVFIDIITSPSTEKNTPSSLRVNN